MKQITQTKYFSPTHLDISGGTYDGQTSNAQTYLSTITSGSSGNGIGTSVQSTVIIKDLKNQLPGIIQSANSELDFEIIFDAKKRSFLSSSAYIKFLLGYYQPNSNITNNTIPVFYSDTNKYYNIPTSNNNALCSFFYYWNGSSFSKASDSTPYSIDSTSSFFIKSDSLSTSWKNNLSLELAKNVDPGYDHFAISFLIEEAYLRNVQLKVSYQVKCYEIGVSSNNTSYGTVSVNNNGQSIIVNGTGTAMTITASPQSGYVFKHWIDTSTGSIFSTNASHSFTPSSDKNYQAIFEPSSYTITAQSKNTSYGTVYPTGGTYSYGSTFTSTATPKTNYKFDGWYKDGSLVTSDAQLSVTVSGNATYTAQFSKKQYTITYVSDGTSISTQVVDAGSSFYLLSAITKDGTSSESNDFQTTFNSNSGSWSDGSTATSKSVKPVKYMSYTFNGWNDGSTTITANSSYTPTGNTTFTAKWIESYYYIVTAPSINKNASKSERTVIFKKNDGTTSQEKATSSQTTTYSFNGWYTSSSGGTVKISTNGGNYRTFSGENLYAQWGSTSTGYSKVTFPTFSRDGYTLEGFATSSTATATSVEYKAGDEAAVSGTWYAVWSLDTFKLSYDADGGSGSFSDQTGNVTYTISSTRPKRTGYNFQGWSLTKGAKTADYYPGGTITISKNTTLYAVWTQETISSKTSKDTTISYAGQIYWYKFTPTTAGEYVMYSTGSSDTYGYIYNSSGTSLDVDDDEGDSTNFRVSYSLSANTPYYFGVKYLSSSSTGTIRINLGPVYTISYNNNGGGTAPNSQSKDWNKNITLSSNTLTRDYYEFKGWATTASDTEPDYTTGATFSTDENTTLYAVWTPIDYSITYYLNGGKVATENLTSYNTETNTFTLNNPTRDGYDFTGWTGTNGTTPSKTITITKGSGGNRTYTANWNNKILTITLDNQSANTSGTTKAYLKYNNGWYSNLGVTTQITSITKPTKKGHTFKGYYTQVNGKGDCIINSNGVPQSNTFTLINTTIYAYWTINYYSITHSMNTDTSIGNKYTVKDASNNSISSGSTYAYDSQIKLEATGNNLQGYDFLRWEINGSSVAASSYTFKLTQDTTIKAYFGKRDMSIIVNLYDENNKPSSISPEEEDSHIKLWIRQLNDDGTYSSWEKKYFNAPIVYSQATYIQVIIQDGEDYEFVSSDNDKFNKYTDILINTEIPSSVYFKKILEINSIYLGKSDKPYTSGYINDPNLSFKEEISSIWVGNKQIMGKAPTRPYPYLEDTLLGNTLYIGKNNSFINSYKNNLNIYKVIIPEGIVYTENSGFFGCSNLTSVILPKSLTTLGIHAFEATNLKSLYLPKNIEILETRALRAMSNLEKITFSNNLKTVNASNLSGSKITTMNFLKTNLKTINSSAFNSMSYLTTILLPNTLTIIETNAFNYDYNLTKVIYNGTIEQWNNININSTGNKYLLNATIYCKNGIINPKEEN